MANYFSKAIQSIYPQMEQQYGDVTRNYIDPNLYNSSIGQQNYNQLADASYGINRDTGQISSIGLTPDQQSNILQLNSDGTGLRGVNPMTDQQAQELQLTPQEQSAIQGDPNAPVQQLGSSLTGLDQQTQDIYGNILGSVNPKAIGLDPAIQGRIQGALGQESQTLNSAANNPNLQVSPQTYGDIIQAAGSAAGGQYQAAADQIQRASQAAGNASPLAINAAEQDLNRRGAIAAANAMSGAQVQAEQERLGAAQDIASRQMQAGESLAGSQIGAATTAQGQEIGAAEAGQGLGLSAATQAGGLATGAKEYGIGTMLGAQQTADSQASQRAANIAGNRQQMGLTTQNTQYTQGMGVNTAMSNRYGGIANTNINQANNQRNYLTGMYGSNVQQNQTGVNQRLGQINNQGNLGINAYRSAYGSQSPSLTSQLIGGAASAAGAYFGG